MGKLDIAWFAGLYEGEGCISFSPSRSVFQLFITSSDLDVLERCKKMWNTGNIYQQNGTNKPCYNWKPFAKDIERIVKAILPYLCERRTQQVYNIVEARNKKMKRKIIL